MATPVHTVRETEAGQTLAKVLRNIDPELTWNRARQLCTGGRVERNGAVERDPATRVTAGDGIAIRERGMRERRGHLARAAIIYLDRDVAIVDKPTPILTVPFTEGDRDTLVDITRARLRREDSRGGAELGVVQRLDKETSGVLVFARTLAAKRELQRQWRAHTIERCYWAVCHGRPRDASHDTWLIRNRGDGLRGSFGSFRRGHGAPPRDARRAITHVRVLEPLAGACLVECRLETGRQHQIRIHLSEAGHPIVGEQVYIRGYPERPLKAPRVMLHARVLGFTHPRTGKPMRFEVDPPEDFAKRLQSLRVRGS